VWGHVFVAANAKVGIEVCRIHFSQNMLIGELNLDNKWKSDDLLFNNNERNLPSFQPVKTRPHMTYNVLVGR